jgi:hypothetical protein
MSSNSLSSQSLSLGQNLNQAVNGATNATYLSATGIGKTRPINEQHLDTSILGSSPSASDSSSALMQTIQSALNQAGVSAPVSSGAQQEMHQFMHALIGAVKSIDSNLSANGATNSNAANNPYSSIASGVQNLLGQLDLQTKSPNTLEGSTVSSSSISGASPSLQTLSSAFENLAQTSSASFASSGSNTNVLGIPQGLPGTQPTLQAFLQNLQDALTKGSAANSTYLNSVGGLVSASA